MNKRRYRWHFHFNAMHNTVVEKEEMKHTHSFLVILCMEMEQLDLEKQNKCEKQLKEYFATYNGKYLNELAVFKDKVPTIENICEVLYEDTQKIATTHDMKQIQIEVGDSPVALYSIGEKLLVGTMDREIPEKQFEKYKEQLNLQ